MTVGRLVRWIYTIIMGFLVVMSVFWLFTAPVTSCLELSGGAGATQRTCESDYSVLIVPALLLAASLFALVLSARRLRTPPAGA